DPFGVESGREGARRRRVAEREGDWAAGHRASEVESHAGPAGFEFHVARAAQAEPFSPVEVEPGELEPRGGGAVLGGELDRERRPARGALSARPACQLYLAAGLQAPLGLERHLRERGEPRGPEGAESRRLPPRVDPEAHLAV